MSYENRYSGAITITPPLTRNQINTFRDSVHTGFTDVKLRIINNEEISDDGETVTVRTIADAIIPVSDRYSGYNIVEDIMRVFEVFPEHEFGGYIEVHWDPGFRDPLPARYVIMDGAVVEFRAELTWPGGTQ